MLNAMMRHDFMPVVDANDHMVGVLHRVDLINAAPEATAADLARKDLPVVYDDEVIHDVVQRFLNGKFRACPVVERASGQLLGMLTAFDVLKAKDWEYRQETTEPQQWNPTLLRFGQSGGKSIGRPSTAERP